MQKNKKNLDSYLTQYANVDWKWVRHLSWKAKITKILEENIEVVNLCDFGLGNELLDLTPRAQQPKKTEINETLSKLKTLLLFKGHYQES